MNEQLLKVSATLSKSPFQTLQNLAGLASNPFYPSVQKPEGVASNPLLPHPPYTHTHIHTYIHNSLQGSKGYGFFASKYQELQNY